MTGPTGSGRVVVIEVLRPRSRRRDDVEKGGRDNEGKSLLDVMRDGGRNDGMQTFDQVIEPLVRRRAVTVAVGLSYATNAGNLRIELADVQG